MSRRGGGVLKRGRSKPALASTLCHRGDGDEKVMCAAEEDLLGCCGRKPRLGKREETGSTPKFLACAVCNGEMLIAGGAEGELAQEQCESG